MDGATQRFSSRLRLVPIGPLADFDNAASLGRGLAVDQPAGLGVKAATRSTGLVITFVERFVERTVEQSSSQSPWR